MSRLYNNIARQATANISFQKYYKTNTRSFPDKGQQIFDTSAVSYFFPNLD